MTLTPQQRDRIAQNKTRALAKKRARRNLNTSSWNIVRATDCWVDAASAGGQPEPPATDAQPAEETGLRAAPSQEDLQPLRSLQAAEPGESPCGSDPVSPVAAEGQPKPPNSSAQPTETAQPSVLAAADGQVGLPSARPRGVSLASEPNSPVAEEGPLNPPKSNSLPSSGSSTPDAAATTAAAEETPCAPSREDLLDLIDLEELGGTAPWPPGLDLRTAKALLQGHQAPVPAVHSSSNDRLVVVSLAAASDTPALAAPESHSDRQALADLVELHELGDKVQWPQGWDIRAARLFLATPRAPSGLSAPPAEDAPT